MFRAIAPVFPGPVYLICQNTFRIITFAVKAEIKFCTKFNRCFDLTSDDRPELWPRNTYNAMLLRMDSVIIHILLLFIQPDDGKIQTDILTCHGISITHELFQIAKLSAECAVDNVCLQAHRLHQGSAFLCVYLLLQYHHHWFFLRMAE